MLVFAIDSANRRGGIAVARDSEVLASRSLEPPDGFAGALFPAIRDLLGELRLRPSEIDLWAATTGPGSFTGIRVGLSAVKALAEANGKLVGPVSLLEALAYAGEGELRAPVLDARRGEVYSALYGPELEILLAPAVGTFADFDARLDGREPLFLSTDERALPTERQRLIVPVVAEPLALLAARRLGVPPEAVEPLYIRPPDVREPK